MSYYVYVLYSEKDGKRYTGITDNLERRIKEHQEGKVISTKWRLPLRLVYYEWCEDIKDAMRREKYLKTFFGKSYIKKRIYNAFKDERSKEGY